MSVSSGLKVVAVESKARYGRPRRSMERGRGWPSSRPRRSRGSRATLCSVAAVTSPPAASAGPDDHTDGEVQERMAARRRWRSRRWGRHEEAPPRDQLDAGARRRYASAIVLAAIFAGHPSWSMVCGLRWSTRPLRPGLGTWLVRYTTMPWAIALFS